MVTPPALGGVDFTKYALLTIIQYVQRSSIGEVKNNYCFIIKHPHAHLQYVCNIPAKGKKDAPKMLGGVAFTKHALSA